MKRIYKNTVDIDELSIKNFYVKRSIDKIELDIDAPVVLCGDKDKTKIEEWTNFEVENRLPLLKLDESSCILELGCGTGRISKFLAKDIQAYLGIDYVNEFIEIAKKRKDINRASNIHFLNASFRYIVDNADKLPTKNKFNRFVISGGVLMYINDKELKHCINKLLDLMEEKSIIYISEPVAIKERLTLNKFYSDDLESEYSAIYRTCSEYEEIFKPFLESGFKLKMSEEFFYNDIKLQKETKQWMFILKR
ncbi:class I SAM-dependent methyltransferase [Paraclostridium bifermentans]|uniref:class I SAM-dependent methyltransferase n=1 Tax=Paraclostridium bifermentans TaxID=1490 RepID=UPI0018990A8A|nr:class I SAM-dependent methyltransferase [Paraclostridium bifermentans]